jgi:hypothetical protein
MRTKGSLSILSKFSQNALAGASALANFSTPDAFQWLFRPRARVIQVRARAAAIIKTKRALAFTKDTKKTEEGTRSLDFVTAIEQLISSAMK